jgi:hypothetical protein
MLARAGEVYEILAWIDGSKHKRSQPPFAATDPWWSERDIIYERHFLARFPTESLIHASPFQERVRLNLRRRARRIMRFVGVQRLAAILEDMQVRVRPSHDPQRSREPMPAQFDGGADITERCILGISTMLLGERKARIGCFVLRSPMNIAHDTVTSHPRLWGLWKLRRQYREDKEKVTRSYGDASRAKPLGTLQFVGCSQARLDLQLRVIPQARRALSHRGMMRVGTVRIKTAC